MPSQNAKVTQRIGVTTSPCHTASQREGRTIWAGSSRTTSRGDRRQRATTFTSTDDFEVEGKKLAAGPTPS